MTIFTEEYCQQQADRLKDENAWHDKNCDSVKGLYKAHIQTKSWKEKFSAKSYAYEK